VAIIWEIIFQFARDWDKIRGNNLFQFARDWEKTKREIYNNSAKIGIK
jgi:hypothetical protein